MRSAGAACPTHGNGLLPVSLSPSGPWVLTWDVSRQVSLADRWGNGDRSILAELPGTPTAAAWGITLTPSQTAMLGGPPGVGLHPSFAYEIVFHVAAFALMWRYRDRLPHPGDLFICYVTSYALFRFGVEFVRGNEMLWLGMSRPQWFLLVILPLLFWRMLRVFGKPLRPKVEGRVA